jgi:phosphoenolpyruvate carboxylase
MRIIPTTMASQHPDHASRPYWHDQEYISTQYEPHETFLSFSELGIGETKWDWEGKLVDESVLERLLGEYFDYFSKHQIGVEKFITFRLPNPSVETEFRLGRAFMGILSAAALAKKVGMASPPIFEVILPMTDSAHSMIDIQEAFREMAGLKHWLLNYQGANMKHVEIIPLFEQVDVITKSDQILSEYIKLHEEKFGFTPEYIRPYTARSDPAMNAGQIPTIMAIKIALSKYVDFTKKTGVATFPILGCAALPFRGGLTPKNVPDFIKQYSGFSTLLLQSAFRYDYFKDDVIKAIQEIDTLLPQSVAQHVDPEEEKTMLEIIATGQKLYQDSIKIVAPKINYIANFIPKRRERVQHVGLFGYSRGVGEISLPRAIKFTASAYSLGVPPEFYSTGRLLKSIQQKNQIEVLEKFYPNLRSDLIQTGGYLNKSNLQKLGWKEIQEDVEQIEIFLQQELKPQTSVQLEHLELTNYIFENMDKDPDLGETIVEAAILRKSIG